MALPVLITALTPVVDKLLSFIPNPAAKERARMEAERVIAAQELEILKMAREADKDQTEINKIEAAHPNIFVSGWRPACAWVCVVGFAWATVIQPITVFTLAALHHKMVTPEIQTDVLMQALFGLLGLGVMRTIEKSRGVARK